MFGVTKTLVKAQMTASKESPKAKEQATLCPDVAQLAPTTFVSHVENQATGDINANNSTVNNKDKYVDIYKSFDVNCVSDLSMQNNGQKSFSFEGSKTVVSNIAVASQSSDIPGSFISVRGRLAKNLHFWQSIGAPQDVLDVITEGYRIPFVREVISE